MRLRCPNCHEPLDAALTCVHAHHFTERQGVLVLLADEFDTRLQAFLSGFEALREREHQRLIDPAAYEHLPQIRSRDRSWDVEWRLRRYDLASVLDRLQNQAVRSLRVLDIGAWNGWLSHQLAKRGHDVTAVDYFVDEYDGLGARRFYSSTWRAIQLDLDDLTVLDEPFDVIILNRCAQFFTDPAALLRTTRARLAPEGQLIITGLQFFRDPRPKARTVVQAQQTYRARTGFDLFLKPTKGYLDFEDRRRFQADGVQLCAYPQLWPANLKARFRPERPRHEYGVWRAESHG